MNITLLNSISEWGWVVSDSLRPQELYSLWNSLGQNTGVGSLSLLQAIFPTWGSNFTLQEDSSPAEPQGKPKNTGGGSLSLLQQIPDPGIEPGSLALQADSLPIELSGKPLKFNIDILKTIWRSSVVRGRIPCSHHCSAHSIPGQGNFLYGLSRLLISKESACQLRRLWFDPCVGKIPWRRKWQPVPIFLPGKSQEQRNLAGYSYWGCKV